jgi:hypothetical protein
MIMLRWLFFYLREFSPKVGEMTAKPPERVERKGSKSSLQSLNEVEQFVVVSVYYVGAVYRVADGAFGRVEHTCGND